MLTRYLSLFGIAIYATFIGLLCEPCLGAPGAARAAAAEASSFPISSIDARSTRPVMDFTMTPFTARQGAPSDVNWIAQSADGFLWLSSKAGLVRFDGITFESNLGSAVPAEGVSTIFVDLNGDLWVGFEDGKVVRRANGVFSEVDQGLPKGGRIIWSIVRDSMGKLWVTSGYGIYLFNGVGWQEVGSDIGSNVDSVYGFAGIFDDGRLFVANSRRTWFNVPGTKMFERGDMSKVWKAELGFDYSQLPAGNAADKLKEAISQPPGVALRTISKDSAGTIWSLETNINRFRWDVSSKGDRQLVVDVFDHGAPGYTVYPDREGNVWSGDADGIRRFRPNKFLSAFPKGALPQASLVAGDGNSVWLVPSQDGDVYAIENDKATKWETLGRGFASVSRDREGAVWFLRNTADSKEDDIRVLRAGQVDHISYPAGINGRAAETILDDPAGGHLLVTTLGLYRYKDASWLPSPVYKELPNDPPIRAISDRFGRVWVVYTENRVALIDKRGSKLFSSRDGITVGDVWSVCVGPTLTWVAGSSGIAYFVGGHFVSINPLTRLSGGGITRIKEVVETEGGDLWINGGFGVAHIPREEITKTLASSGYRPKAEVFDDEDGLQGGASPNDHGASLLLDRMDRLWVSRSLGVSWIDTQHIPRDPIAPQVVFTQFDSDGSPQALSGGAKLPALTHIVVISYSAPSLSMSERVHYLIKLRGFDHAWRDVAGSRSATFTNLGPGEYTLLVRAANEDGVWSDDASALRFIILPAFYQTLWFKSSLGVLSLFFGWLIYSLRSRQMHAKFLLQLNAVHVERDRIARELHDTLMQGVNGLVLQVRSWSADSSLGEVRRKEMQRAANLASTLLIEGRENIRTMRDFGEMDIDLMQEFREVCTDCAVIYPSSFHLSQHGEFQRLRTEYGREVLNIGREAIRNAFMHSGASEISVSIIYGAGALVLTVTDNGKGISSESLDCKGKFGHWGIVGMGERADRIGASLTIRRRKSGGVEVLLNAPARRIYVGHVGRIRGLWASIRFTHGT